MLCNKHKQIRDEWIKSLKINFNDIAKERNTTEYENKIIDEREKDIDKYFNNKGNLCANQQVLGMIELFRRIVVK